MTLRASLKRTSLGEERGVSLLCGCSSLSFGDIWFEDDGGCGLEGVVAVLSERLLLAAGCMALDSESILSDSLTVFRSGECAASRECDCQG